VGIYAGFQRTLSNARLPWRFQYKPRTRTRTRACSRARPSSASVNGVGMPVLRLLVDGAVQVKPFGVCHALACDGEGFVGHVYS
jgi:hypothetical protein